jgi:hypothetical protein
MDEGAQLSDSLEYRDGVFTATVRSGAAGDPDLAPNAATGTALMARPGDCLAPFDAPGPLLSADLPPTGPVSPTPSPFRAPGSARRFAVATIVASLIAAVAFGAAAFGDAFGSDAPAPGSARGALGAAATASVEAPSVTFALSATQSTSTAITTLVSGSGTVNLKADVGHVSATLPTLSGLVGRGNDAVDVISDGSSVYLGSPAVSSLTGGPRWLKVDLPQGTNSGNVATSTLGVLANPSQLLGLLASIGGQVTTIGIVDLHGTRTTEYRTIVSVSELAARAGMPTGSALGAKVSKALGQLGNSTVPVTVWVGGDGYVRQINAAIELSRATLGSIASDLITGTLSGSSGQATTSTMVTVAFSHYGDPVKVGVPPASQVVDASAVTSSMAGVASAIRDAVSDIAATI